MQSESSTFVSLLTNQGFPKNSRLQHHLADWNPIWQYFASIQLLFISSMNANLKKISPQSATPQSGQNILHKVHPKIICHLPPCLIGSGLSRGIQCLFKLVWKTLNCVCWSRHKNHLYLLALQRYAVVLEFLILENFSNGKN